MNTEVETNTYKDYDECSVERLEIILEAKEVGFTLAEIRSLLDSWYGSSGSRTETLKLFQEKIMEIDKRIKQFRQIKKRLIQVCDELEQNNC